MTDLLETQIDRRAALRLATLGLAAGIFADPASSSAQVSTAPASGFAALRDRPLNIGALIFPNIDQIDFTGPFEVLVRLPDSRFHVIGVQDGPIRDHKGLVLTPDTTLASPPSLDVLVVPGGLGQQALMQDDRVLNFIRSHVEAGRPLFSVCTGALLCGAAGVLKGRSATTHWAALELLSYFGAIPNPARVVIDGAVVTAAGVTAGLDGAFVVASLLRGDDAARQIQLDIQYAPQPPFDSGLPETAPPHVREAVQARYAALTAERRETARAVAQRLGVRVGG